VVTGEFWRARHGSYFSWGGEIRRPRRLRKDEHDLGIRPGLLASCGQAVAGARAEILGKGRDAAGSREDREGLCAIAGCDDGIPEPGGGDGDGVRGGAARRPYWGEGTRQIH
jgi:hypothetical protein